MNEDLPAYFRRLADEIEEEEAYWSPEAITERIWAKVQTALTLL